VEILAGPEFDPPAEEWIVETRLASFVDDHAFLAQVSGMRRGAPLRASLSGVT
jgi:hypothetical protein